jgi:hypothetical protein
MTAKLSSMSGLAAATVIIPVFLAAIVVVFR